MFKILLIILFYSILINKLTIAINDENSKDSSINEEDPFYLKFKNMEKLMNALNFKKNNKINNDKMTTSTTMEIKTSSTNTTTKTTKLLTTTLLTTTNKIPTTTETTTNTSSSTTTDKPTNYIYIKSVGWMVYFFKNNLNKLFKKD
uniref:Uncharacterized protein n=1 Tax=Meloidogyne hapla TaxID=6305 RepID=A0A1I8B642_MELHA